VAEAVIVAAQIALGKQAGLEQILLAVAAPGEMLEGVVPAGGA
jgi:hypothetical protein